MTDSIETSDREAEDPREPIRLPVREMRDEPVPDASLRAVQEVWLPPLPDTEVARTAPKLIWLNIFGTEDDYESGFPDNHEDITWCEDNVGDLDVPYIRVDAARTAIAAAGGGVPQGQIPSLKDLCEQVAKHLGSGWLVIGPDGSTFQDETPHRAANAASKHRTRMLYEPEKAAELQAVIDGIQRSREEDDARLLETYGTLNCPMCGGSGHVGDAMLASSPQPEAAPAVAQVPDGLVDAIDRVLDEAHCDCPHKMRFDDGEHYAHCPLFDLNIARLEMLAAATKAPAQADNWQQYAKDGETAQDVIERERKDNHALLSLLAKARSGGAAHWALKEVRQYAVNNRCDGDSDFAGGVAAANGNIVKFIDYLIEQQLAAPAQAAPPTQPEAAQSAGEVERGDVVAFEFYNRATGHAIVDYSVNTHVGNLSAAKGYEARPLVYAAPRQNVLDGSKSIPTWQAREALDELEAAARGDTPFNHQAAAVVRAALSHKEQP